MTELNERIFLGKANEGMESLVGVPLQELATKEKIDLPSSIFLFACGAIDRTSLDFRERLAIFQVGERGVKIEKKCVGAETDFKRKEQETYVFWPWESIYRRYFAHPVSVLFHTHPQYTRDYFDFRGVTGITEPTLGHFNLEQTAAILNTGVPGFSCQDLKLFENHSRYIRSMLLGSAFGYRWVINPRRVIQLTDFSRRARFYSE